MGDFADAQIRAGSYRRFSRHPGGTNPQELRRRRHLGIPDRGRTEVYTAADAYYVPPGHVQIHHNGAQVVEFSPTERGRRPALPAVGK
jgi:hypothetical protein